MNDSVSRALHGFDSSIHGKESNFSKMDEGQQKEISRADNEARGKITTFFVRGFFLSIAGGGLFVLLYNYCAVLWIESLNDRGLIEVASKISLLELDKVLSLIISALGTSLGFIIGYYFKEKSS
ncbi:hypothetical protein V5094_13820 [Moellerella wisconsensis]|uniref:hypothetical protein n=1 Tax=Moellerella wisconsensis TaxID=158849 RepID=UPI001F4E1E0C|nr:hypothetical protein [Moellerella wisconsensis]UNH23115.1 hypothetical protein MNY68_09645 [Moellerella wisconsensis]